MRFLSAVGCACVYSFPDFMIDAGEWKRVKGATGADDRHISIKAFTFLPWNQRQTIGSLVI